MSIRVLVGTAQLVRKVSISWLRRMGQATKFTMHIVHRSVVLAQPWGILLAAVGVAIASLSFLIDLRDRHLNRELAAWRLLLQVGSLTPTHDGRRVAAGSATRAALEYLNRSYDGKWCFGWVRELSEYVIGEEDRRCLLPRQMAESFADINLPNAKLAGARLPRSRFHRANLHNVDFADADLRHGIFVFVDLSSASLSCTDMRRTELYGADLTHARLRQTRLDGADLRYANLTRVRASLSFFPDALLNRANLEKADFTGAIFDGAQLSRANLRGANFREASLRGATFARADVAGATFERADLSFADLSDVENLSEVELRGACAASAPKLPKGVSRHFASCKDIERQTRCAGAHWVQEYEPK